MLHGSICHQNIAMEKSVPQSIPLCSRTSRPHAADMPDLQEIHGSRKRKQSNATQENRAPKKTRENASQMVTPSLAGHHATILAELASKYDVVCASIISSTQIRKRVTNVTTHLLHPSPRKPHIVLLHARTAEVCKMITVVEQCKRVLVEEGRAWYQYNQMFDLPKTAKSKEVVEETVLEKKDENEAEDGDSDDDFELMQTRFKNAILPPPPTHTTKSLRIFLSATSISELRIIGGITVQASNETTTEGK
jgi:hypothetical protein